jgi:hypothetical protein
MSQKSTGKFPQTFIIKKETERPLKYAFARPLSHFVEAYTQPQLLDPKVDFKLKSVLKLQKKKLTEHRKSQPLFPKTLIEDTENQNSLNSGVRNQKSVALLKKCKSNDLFELARKALSRSKENLKTKLRLTENRHSVSSKQIQISFRKPSAETSIKTLKRKDSKPENQKYSALLDFFSRNKRFKTTKECSCEKMRRRSKEKNLVDPVIPQEINLLRQKLESVFTAFEGLKEENQSLNQKIASFNLFKRKKENR